MLLAVAAMWGTNFSVLKVSLADVPPLFFASSRFAVAALLMVPLAWVAGDSLKLPRRYVWPTLGVGLLGNGLYMLIFVYGAARTTADNAALILATVPIWVALFAAAAGMERVVRWGWAGVALSLVGIACIVSGAAAGSDLEFGGASITGDLMILGATLAWAGYSVLVRPIVRRCSPIAVTVWSAVAAAVPLGLLTVLLLPAEAVTEIPRRGWITLLVSAVIGIALPYVIWNHAIRAIGSSRTSLYTYLVPLIALVVAWLWLGETLTPVQFLGGGLVLVGVVLARRFMQAPAEA